MFWACLILIAIALLASYWAWCVSDEVESILIIIPAVICLLSGIVVAPILVKVAILAVVLLIHRSAQADFRRSEK